MNEVYARWLDEELKESARLHRELNRSWRRAGLFWFPLGWVFGAVVQMLIAGL